MLCIGDIEDSMASFSKRVKMLDEVASSEEMPLIEIPQLGNKGTKQWRLAKTVCISSFSL